MQESLLLNEVEQTISAHQMIQSGDSVLVAVSGGPDSVALFHLLFTLAGRYSLRLGIAHIDHCLRNTESDRDARFVASFAHTYRVPFHIEKTDVGNFARAHRLSIEEAGRQVRYAYLERVARQEKYDKIALGHQSDDTAELILMLMIRGSGLQGISGIPPVREGKFVRPLIRQTRSEILSYLYRHRIDFVSDSTNADLRPLRNRIRNHLIPLLGRDYNPNIVKALNRLATIARSDNDWLEQQAQKLLESIAAETAGNRIDIACQDLNALHPAVRRRVIRRCIHKVKGDLRRIRFDHVEAVIRLVGKGPACGSLDLPDRIRVQRSRDELIFSKEENPLRRIRPFTGLKAEDFVYRIGEPMTSWIPEMNMYLSLSILPAEGGRDVKASGQNVAFFDMDAVRFPLVLRNIRSGDRFVPLGMKSSQRVSDFLARRKISRQLRTHCAVLMSAEKIIWVLGIRIDDSVKLTDSTRRMLKAELFLA